MDRLRCVVERITYQNEQNGYSVIKCKAKGFVDLVTVVGAMPEVHIGAVLTLNGFWKMDARYGRQFSVETFEETLPATVLGIEKYLGSGLVKGIGPKFAKRIVQEFGTETLNVIEENPDDLIRVPGIGKVRVERIKKSWVEQKEIKNIMQIRNNYDKEVFNGDIGVVASVDLEDRELVVNFDDREIRYDVTELDELVLAYATTIHKAQGSEYPIVVMPIMMTHYVMLQRNLIYTGITRAKKCLIIVGTKKAISAAVRTVTVSRRNTMLTTRIRAGMRNQ